MRVSLILYSPVVILCTTRCSILKFYVLPTQCIYVFCVDLKTKRNYFPIQHYVIGFYNRYWVCLLRGTDWIFKCNKPYALNSRLLTANTRVRSQVIPCEICGGQCGTGTGFTQSTWAPPVNITPPMPNARLHLHAALTSRTNRQLLETQKKKCCFENRVALDRKLFFT